jgi:hypothetical protein
VPAVSELTAVAGIHPPEPQGKLHTAAHMRWLCSAHAPTGSTTATASRPRMRRADPSFTWTSVPTAHQRSSTTFCELIGPPVPTRAEARGRVGEQVGRCGLSFVRSYGVFRCWRQRCCGGWGSDHGGSGHAVCAHQQRCACCLLLLVTRRLQPSARRVANQRAGERGISACQYSR